MKLKNGDIVTLRNGDTAKINEVGNSGTVHGTRTNSKGNTFKNAWSNKTGWDGLGNAAEDIVKINGKNI